jgi:hypothetical protein
MAMMVVGADDEVIIGDENDGTMRAVAGGIGDCQKALNETNQTITFN